jgi:hypothetical protein
MQTACKVHMSNQLHDRECDLDLLQRVYREPGLMIRRKKGKHCVRVGQPLRRLDGGDAVDAANSSRLQTMYEDALEKSRTSMWPVNQSAQ